MKVNGKSKTPITSAQSNDKSGKGSKSSSGKPGGTKARASQQTSRKKTSGVESTVLGRISDGILALDSGLNYTYINDRAGVLLGYEAVELIGRSLWQAHPGADGTPFAEACKRALETQTIVPLDGYFPASDRWLEGRVYPSKDGVSILITEGLQQKQEEDRRREERYRILFDTMQEGFMLGEVIDGDSNETPDGRFVEVNASMARYLGKSRDELIGRSIRQMLASGEHGLDVLERACRLARGEEQQFSVERQDPSSERWLRAHFFSPRPGQFASLLTDITDEKQNEARIRDVSKFPGENPNPVMRFTLDGRILYANQASASLLRAWENGEQNTTPLDEIRELLPFIMETKANREVEVRNQGTYFAGLLVPVQEGQYVNLYLRDITERKQAEETLRAHINQANAGIARTDLAGRYIFVNQAFCAMLGYSEQELVGKNIWEFSHPDDISKYKRMFERMVIEGQPFQIEKRLLRRNGSVLWVNVGTSPLRDAAGQIQAATSIIVDVTRRKTAEESLLDSARRTLYLSSLSDTIRSMDDPSKMQIEAACLLGAHLKASRAAYIEIEPDGSAYIRDNYMDGVPDITGEFQLSACIPEEVLSRIQEGRTLVASDIQLDSRFSLQQKARLEALSVRAQILVPVIHQGELIAALWVQQSQARIWKNEEISLVEDTAERLRAAIERAHAERKLRESEERLRLASHASKMCTWEMNLQDQTYKLGENFTEVLGFPAEVLPKNSAEVFKLLNVSEDMKAVQEVVSRAIQSRSELPALQFRVVNPNTRQVVWLEVNARLVYDHDGKPYRMFGMAQNITERKSVEEQLRAKDAELEEVINHTSFMLTRCTRDLRFRFVSRAYAEMIGRAPEEVMGRPIVEIIGEEALSIIQPYAERVLQGERVEYESEIPFAGVGTLVLHVVYTPDRDEQGNVLGWFASIMDITERKHSEQALAEFARHQEALYQLADHLQGAETLEQVFDPTLDAILSSLQCDRASILLFDDQDVMRFVAWRGLSDAYRRATDGHSPWKRDERDARPISMDDVRTAQLSDSLRTTIQEEGIGALAFIPLVSNEKLIGKFMVYYNQPHTFSEVDVELSQTIAYQLASNIERKQAEKALRESQLRLSLIYNHTGSGIVETSPDGRIIGCNDEYCRLLGYTREELLALSFHDVTYAEDDQLEASLYLQLMAEEIPFYHIEKRFVKKDGSIVWGELVRSVVRTPAGKALFGIGSVLDVSERKQAEDALRRSEERFREIFETAGVSVWVEDFTAVKAAIEELRAQGVRDFQSYLAEHPEFVRAAINMVSILDVNNETLDLFNAHSKADVLGSLGRIFQPGSEPVFAREILAIAEGREMLREEIPLRALDGQPISVIFSVHFNPVADDFSRVVVTFTDITERKRAEEQLKAARKNAEAAAYRMTQLQKVTAALSEALTPAQVAEVLVEQGAPALGAVGSSVILLADDGQMLEMITSTLAPETIIRPYKRFPLSLNIPAADAVRSRKTIWIESQEQYLERYPHLTDQIKIWNQQAAVSIPMEYEGRILGVFALSFDRILSYTREDAEYALTLARQGAQAFERARAENALRLDAIMMENVAAGVYLVSASDGTILHTNPKFDTLFGYEPGEVIGKHVSIINAPTGRSPEEVAEEIISALKRDDSWQGEVYSIRKDGTLFWSFASITTFEHATYGTVWVAARQDIHDRKQKEEALRARTEEIEALMEVSPFGILVAHDPECKHITGNPAAYSLLGFPQDSDENLSKPVLDEIRPSQSHQVFRNGVKLSTEDLPMQMAARLGVEVQDETLELRFEDGTQKFIYIFAKPLFDSRGKSRGAIAAVLDVTERKQNEEALRESEQRYRAIVNQATAGIVRKDAAGRLLFVNQAFCSMLDQTDAELMKKTIWELTHEEDVTENKRLYNRLMAEGTPFQMEKRLLRQDGSILWVNVSVSPVLDAFGTPHSAVAVYVDISRRKQAEGRMALLAIINELIREFEDPDELLFAVSRAVGEHFHVKRSLFNEIDLDRDLEIVHRDYCRGVESVAGEHKISAYSSIASAEMMVGKTVVNRDSKVDPRTAAEYERSYVRYGERAYVAVPLMHEERWVASLWISDDKPREWDRDDVYLLEAIAERTWTATEKLRVDRALRDSEERLRVTFNTTAVGFAMLKPDTSFMDANEAFCQMVDYSREELMSMNWDMLTHPNFIVDSRNRLAQLIAGEISSFTLEEIYIRGDGDEIWIQNDVSLVRDGEGQPLHLIAISQDITDRKREEEALRARTEEIETLMNVSPIAIFVAHDPACRHISANPAGYRLLEMPENFGGNVSKSVPPEEQPTYKLFRDGVELAPEDMPMQTAARLGTEEKDETLELRFENGSQKYLYSFTKPLFDVKGKPRGAISAMLDITERKRAEQELHELNLRLEEHVQRRTAELQSAYEFLRESEATSRLILESMPDAIVITDREGRIVHANTQVETLFGYSPSEVIGQPVEILLPERIREKHVKNRTSFASQRTRRFMGLGLDLFGRRKDESKFPVDVMLSPIDNNTTWDVMVAIRDSTKQREAQDALRTNEEKLRTLFEILPVGISFLGRDGKITEMNTALAEILGLSKQDLLKGAYKARRYIRADGSPMPPEEIASRRAVTEQKTVYNVETGIIKENGEILWTSVNAAPVQVADVEAAVVTIDITQRKQAEEALHKHRERLRVLSRRLVEVQEEERRAIARELHDRVGQNLAALTLNLNILRNQLSSEILEKVGTRLNDSVNLVKDILTITRSVMGDLRPNVLDDYGLDAALSEYAERFTQRFGIRVITRQPAVPIPRLDPSIEMTLLRIAQEALTNIARHAKASQAIMSLERDGDTALMTIEDNGTGILSWQKVNQPGSHGLRIMRERAEAFGGYLKIHSTYKNGTKIEVRIPLGSTPQKKIQKEKKP